MDAKTWSSKQENDIYYKNKENSADLIKLCGKYTSDLTITYTYVAICDSKNIDKTHFYYIFTPFVTGFEKSCYLNKTKPWEESYSFTNYRQNIPYFFIKDDCMNVPEEFYNIVNNGRDVYILKYDNYKLEPVSYVFLGLKPTLYCIDFCDNDSDILKKDDFDTWYNRKESRAKLLLKFTCPFKDILPFPGKDIFLDLTKRHTTFSISRDD